MAHAKRRCRVSARDKGRPADFNYVSDRAWKKALRREKLQRQGRKRARGR